MNPELREFLNSIKPLGVSSKSFVFPSVRDKSKPIHYDNFCRNAWSKIVNPITGRKTTPYSCRDTFITEQISKGVNIASVAQWCDTSVKMIESTYFDGSASDVLPV